MSISIDHDAPVQWITLGDKEHPRQVVVDFGRPGMKFYTDVRDIIHWNAYRLDIGIEGRIGNHRLAVVLRAIAERFYPYDECEADLIAEELREAGCTDDFTFIEPQAPVVDVRLLDLKEGMVFLTGTFEEDLSRDYRPHPTLAANAKETIDFMFPLEVHEIFGVRGIRVYVLDLITWFMESNYSAVMIFENLEAWLDRYEYIGLDVQEVGLDYEETRRQQRTARRRTALGPGSDTSVGSDVPGRREAESIEIRA